MNKDTLRLVFHNILLIVLPAYFIRLVVWFITLQIDTGSDVAWKYSSMLKMKKLFVPDIFAQDGLLSAFWVTISITISAWLLCTLLSALLSMLSYIYQSLKKPVNVFISLSNFHLFFGFLFLYFLWGSKITPDWLWATVIVILFNGSFQGMTKEFTEQIIGTFSQKYVLFSISQGINKWRSCRNELTIKILYSALELLPFFLLSTIIIELVFYKLKGLGSILLDNINAIVDNKYDKIDEVFIVIICLISIVRIAKLFSLWLENRLKTI